MYVRRFLVKAVPSWRFSQLLLVTPRQLRENEQAEGGSRGEKKKVTVRE